MGFNSRIKYNQTPTAATATGAVAAGSTVGTAAANKVLMAKVADGTEVGCIVSMKVNTTSLTLTPKWQGSQDGTTWRDLFSANSAANVATAGGTGSDVTTVRDVAIGKRGYKYVRVVFVTGGATAHATADTYEIIGYNWIEAA
jgi:hypothetical protein